MLAPPASGQAPSEPAREREEKPPAASRPQSIASSLGAFGDLGDARATLEAQGITLGIGYVGEAFANLRGGLKRGAAYEGKLDLQLDIDL
ncbi:MAG TPA: carbohydrate porin, partial [Vineibacter sp.]|nr:carbohydrate porin [Vineibacter sp.]